MKVKILKELFNGLDENEDIILVVQRGPEYQEMRDFSYLNDSHPCGSLVMHTTALEDECQATNNTRTTAKDEEC